jgi:hypothetical protein
MRQHHRVSLWLLSANVHSQGLYILPQVTLQPRQTVEYELIYSPLLAGAALGGLTFVNDSMGEFWYELRLHAGPADVVELPEVVAEIGKEGAGALLVENPPPPPPSSRTNRTRRVPHPVLIGHVSSLSQVENPLGEDCEFEVAVSNGGNFRLEAPDDFDGLLEDGDAGLMLLLPPYYRGELTLYYTPSDLGVPEHGLVTLRHPAAGLWEFAATGRGAPPVPFPPHHVSSAVGQSSSNVVPFRNPFAREIAVQIALVPEDGEEPPVGEPAPFVLVAPGEAQEVSIPPGGEIDIAFVFQPRRMEELRCSLEVLCTTELAPAPDGAEPVPCAWVYPVILPHPPHPTPSY